MRSFVLRQNVAHFERLIAQETDLEQRRLLEALLAEARRELLDFLHSAAPPGDAAAPPEGRGGTR